MIIQSALVKMCKFTVFIALMMAMAIATPADRRGQQGRSSQPEGQIEGYDSEDASSMTNKIMECRSILQQAGMIDMNTPGRTTEENETEEPKRMDERMAEGGNAKGRKSFRRY